MMPDAYTSYFVMMEDEQIQLWIKVWQLSSTGCYILHNQGIYQPHRPYHEAEIHLLGLTGKRKQPFAIHQHCIPSTICAILDPIDLGNVGYKKFNINTPGKPKLPTTGILIKYGSTRAIPKTTYSQPWSYEGNTIKKPRSYKTIKFPLFDPIFYPPPYNHHLLNEEFPDPVIFQPGQPIFRFPLINKTTTLEDMITEAVKKEPATDPITTLTTYFNFRREDLESRYLQTPFMAFLAMKELPYGVNNPFCQYNSYPNGINTGERYLIHKSWSSIHHHPLIHEQNFENTIRTYNVHKT